jgi:hypothetical protein
MICLSFCLRASHPNSEAKNTDPKRWKKGFIVTLRGDTIHGTVRINDFLDPYYDYQRMVSFKDQKGTAQYSPNDLNSFSYEDQANPVTLQSVSSPDGDGHIFLRLYYSGSCKVYGYTITEIKGSNATPAGNGTVRSSLIPTEKKYIQVGGSQFYQFKRTSFKKCMEEAFASCPRILSGLNSRAYTYDNLQVLVRDYNTMVRK